VAIASMTGAGGLKRVSDDAVRDFKTYWPELAEQERIANFLDDKTARIDALILEKERLLTSTSEYFKARLGTAVVQGLHKGRRLVDAANKGFEAVPADWDLVPLKHLASFGGGMTPSKDNEEYWRGEIPWVSPKDMKRFVLHDVVDHVSQSALDATSLKLHPVNSVLVVVRGMILAHTFPVAINTVPVTINQDMKALFANSRVSAKFLAWMLRGLQPLMLSLTEESAHGTKALRTDQWANQCVPLPGPDEQAALVEAFEVWEAGALAMSTHLRDHIARLREYRSSLISAAVTGQIDVGAYEVAAC
jgi:type I restriction enzyme S subunit